jgi:hypothetical protein
MNLENEKKPYHCPELSFYGDIREITKNLTSTNGKNDNQGGGNQKTLP